MTQKGKSILKGFGFGFVQIVWGIMILLLAGLVSIRMESFHFAGFMVGMFGGWVSLKITKLFGYNEWRMGDNIGIVAFILPMLLLLVILH